MARRCDNGVPVSPDLHWTFAPSVLLPIAGYVGVYAWRFRAARRETGSRGASSRHALCFAAAILVLLVAAVSPLDGLGEEYLFAAHMVQHVLLSDIAPLLLLLGLSRVIMRPVTRRLMSVERALGPLAHPFTGIAVWFALIYLWHVPAMYEAAIENPVVHALEHASFFTAGLAVWWPLIQPVPMRRPLTGPAAFAYILAAKMGLGGLGLYLAWSSNVAYGVYETFPRVWGLSAIEDQNLGGALMMVEQSLVLAAVLLVLFVKMLARSEQQDLRRERLEDAAAV